MQYWLMKSEPNTFSIDHLIQSPKQITEWEGVRNYQARNFMRDQMKKNDLAFFYHSNCEEPGIVGIVKVVQESHPDLTALDPRSQYYDPKSNTENPRWYLVTVEFVEKFKRTILLSELKQHSPLKNMMLVKPGNRLSITTVSSKEWEYIIRLK